MDSTILRLKSEREASSISTRSFAKSQQADLESIGSNRINDLSETGSSEKKIPFWSVKTIFIEGSFSEQSMSVFKSVLKTWVFPPPILERTRAGDLGADSINFSKKTATEFFLNMTFSSRHRFEACMESLFVVCLTPGLNSPAKML